MKRPDEQTQPLPVSDTSQNKKSSNNENSSVAVSTGVASLMWSCMQIIANTYFVHEYVRKESKTMVVTVKGVENLIVVCVRIAKT